MRKLLIPFLIAVNLAGALFGFFIYYAPQLSATPLALWIFVPDCPLYVLVFALALGLLWLGVENDLFSFIVSAGLLKYGAWTLFALAYLNGYFFSAELALMSGMLFMLHIGMAAEGFVLRVRRCGAAVLAVGLAWFLLNDFFDYFVGTMPYLPSGTDAGTFALFSIASTLVLVPALWVAKRRNLLVPLGIYRKPRR